MTARKCLFAALVALAVLLGGCARVTLTQVQREGDVELPVPAEYVPEAPVGDSREDENVRVTFYVIASDQQQLSAVSRTLRLSGEDTLYERVIERLLTGSAAGNMPGIAPSGTRLIGCELSQGILTVNLSVDALLLDEQALCWMRSALANTMTALPGIDWVNVLIDGKEESGMELPGGTRTQTEGNLTALWAQQQADDDRFLIDPATALIEREATLYFGAWLDNRLLPEVRSITLRDGNFTERILNELRRGPAAARSQSHAVLPAGARLMRSPDVAMLEDGRRVARISFAGDLFDQLELEGLSAYQLFASITLSVCRFVPQLDGVMIGVGGKLVREVSEGLTSRQFEDGVMAPEMFDDAVGRVAKLYFAGAEQTGLRAVERVLNRQSAVSPRALIEQLIAGPFVYDGDARGVMPEGVTEADLLGARIEEGVALINLSSNFYRLCQGLDPAGERDLIYAVVNTLCELDGVKRVRFYVAGAAVSTLAGSICLEGALMPNPGAVAA